MLIVCKIQHNCLQIEKTVLYVITYPIFNDFRTFELLFSPKYTKEIREKQNKNENGNGFRMSPCRNVLLTRMGNAVLFKIVILESLQSICAVDGKLISKRVKPFKFPPKNLNLH